MRGGTNAVIFMLCPVLIHECNDTDAAHNYAIRVSQSGVGVVVKAIHRVIETQG